LFHYRVLKDGWIKVPETEFHRGLPGSRGGRLLIGLNQLLLEIGGRIVLVDAGLGDKRDPSEVGLQDFQRPRRMLSELESNGLSPRDVDIVILTHLHFDHSGGGTRVTQEGIALTFTNALYYLQQAELDYARNPAPERAGDYFADDFEPLVRSGQLILLDGDRELLPELSVHIAPGHSPGHQVVIARERSETVFFPGDLIATRQHIDLRVTMSYDIDPAMVMRQRSKWLAAASRGGWSCVFCHALKDPVGRLDWRGDELP